MSLNLILVIVIAVSVTVIVVVSLTTLITNSIFNKKETEEERKYSVDSLVENASLSQEIKAANKEVKKQQAQPQESNKFVINEPAPAPQPIINNKEVTPSAQETSNAQETKPAEAPIDPFNLNSSANNSEEEIEVFK